MVKSTTYRVSKAHKIALRKPPNRRLRWQISRKKKLNVTDSLNTMLRLLGEESAEASWLIQARSRMDPVELCDEEW